MNCLFAPMKFHFRQIFVLIYLIAHTAITAQTNSYAQDSLKVEGLLLNMETYYNESELFKKNFSIALDIIENKLIPAKDSPYFKLKKGAIRDRQSALLKIEARYDEALSMLLENVNYKEDIGDFKTLAYTYRLIASIFIWQENHDKAEFYYKTGLELARLHDNKKEEVESLLSLSRLHLILEDTQKAKVIIDSANTKLQTFNYPKGLSRLYTSYVTIFRQEKRFEEAISYSQRHIETLNQEKDSTNLGFAFFNLGLTYYQAKRFDEAIESLEKSIKIEGDSVAPGRIKDRYKILSNSYIATNDYKNGYLYASKYIEANENELKVKSYQRTIEQEARYKYQRKKVLDSLQIIQNKKELAASIKRKANNRFWMVVSTLITILLISWFLYYKRKQKIITTELKNKLLRAEIKSKKKDLSEFALNLTHDKEWTKKLFKQFEKYKHARKEEKETEIALLEKEILDKLSYDDITKEFNKRLDGLSNTFYDNLKTEYPTLTKNDIRLCTLIKLKIDTPEIAKLHNISIASVNTSRYRLRKKLNLTASQELDHFIDTFV